MCVCVYELSADMGHPAEPSADVGHPAMPNERVRVPARQARPALQAQDCVSFEPKQHGGVLGHRIDPKQQQDAAERRVVPLPVCGCSWLTSRPAHASKQGEVDGHELACLEVNQGT